MKKAFTIGLASFWIIAVLIAGAGVISYQTQKKNLSNSNGNGTQSGQEGLGGNVQGIDSNIGAPSARVDAAYVATHNTNKNCWIIISSKVYNVTDYIPFHPGGMKVIIDVCGQDATTAFTNRGEGKSTHSQTAWDLLAKYYVADLNAPVSGVGQTSSEAPPSSGAPNTTPTPQPPKSTVTTTPAPKPPVKSTGLTVASVATHNSKNDCYLIISGKVYNVTDYIPFHPGGASAVTNYCGKDATTAFNTKGGGGSHSTNAKSLLANYYIGTLGVAIIIPVDTPLQIVDIIGPIVSFLYPLAGDIILGSVSLSAYATDVSGVSNVQFSIDGKTIRTDSTSPYSATLDTTGYTNGSHALKIVVADKVGNSNSASISVTISNTAAPAQVSGLTSATVATHSSASDCYLIINNNVYDVTQYIPFHPGGASTITNYCGKEATTAFNTKGGGGSHSTNAKSILAGYYVGALGSTAPVVAPTLTTCASFTYSSWGSCQSNGTQARTVTSSSPSGCTGGSPVISQSCTYTPPTTTTSGSLTTSQVAAHSSANDCYVIVNNKVYNVTQYIPFHPGGQSRITSRCGTDITADFLTSSGGHAHSASAQNILAGYYIGTLTTTTTGGTSGGGTTGGTSGGMVQTYTVSVSGSGSFSPSSHTLHAGDSIKFLYTSGDEQNVTFSPNTISGYKLDHEKTSFTRTFSSSGTWTFSAGGGTGSVIVQ
jgi:cytochrome b involved in lipid metabolism